MSPWNHQALVSLRADLKLHLLMETGLGDKLEEAAGGFMNRFEAQTVREQLGNMKQMDKVIDILLGKANKDFATFLKMLWDSNNKVWAEELEKRAEKFKEEGTLCIERRDQSEVHAVIDVELMQFSLLEPIPICVHICVYVRDGTCHSTMCVCAALQEESMHLLWRWGRVVMEQQQERTLRQS